MKEGFTLVELLAVIVVLAVVLLISVSKIGDVARKTKVNVIASTAKLIATKVEEREVENEALQLNDPITCTDVVELDDNYDSNSCMVTKVGGKWTVIIRGANKFEGITCTGTKEEVECNNGIFVTLTVEKNPSTNPFSLV